MSTHSEHPSVTATPVGADEFEVEVRSRVTTRHRVTTSGDYIEQLAGREASTQRVVEAAFDFLLQREPNTAILPRFHLREIERYFPEFRDHLRRWAQAQQR